MGRLEAAHPFAYLEASEDRSNTIPPSSDSLKEESRAELKLASEGTVDRAS